MLSEIVNITEGRSC